MLVRKGSSGSAGQTFILYGKRKAGEINFSLRGGLGASGWLQGFFGEKNEIKTRNGGFRVVTKRNYEFTRNSI